MANVNSRARLRGALVAAIVAVAALTACNRDKILTITDPDIIDPANVASAEGAEALRLGALNRISDVTGGLQGSGSLNEGIFHFSGVVADEWRSTDTFVQRDEADSRSITESNSAMTLESRGRDFRHRCTERASGGPSCRHRQVAGHNREGARSARPRRCRRSYNDYQHHGSP